MQFDEFLKVLDLLQNPDKYAAQIAELTTRHEEIKTSIGHLNDRVNVAVTQATADKNLADAKEIVDKAKQEAQQILAKAQQAFDKRLADLQVRETAAEQAIQAYQQSKQQWADRKAEHIAKENQLNAFQKQLDTVQQDLTKKQLEVDARLSKLRDVMG